MHIGHLQPVRNVWVNGVVVQIGEVKDDRRYMHIGHLQPVRTSWGEWWTRDEKDNRECTPDASSL